VGMAARGLAIPNWGQAGQLAGSPGSPGS